MSFSDLTLQMCSFPRFRGFLSAPPVTGIGGDPCTGVYTVLGLWCQDGTILEARYECVNCVSIVAASEVVCQMLVGSRFSEASCKTVEDIESALGGLPASRKFCLQVVWSALRSCLDKARAGRLL